MPPFASASKKLETECFDNCSSLMMISIGAWQNSESVISAPNKCFTFTHNFTCTSATIPAKVTRHSTIKDKVYHDHNKVDEMKLKKRDRLSIHLNEDDSDLS